MIDTHYDLLSLIEIVTDEKYLKKVKKYFNKNNVTKVIANLYFMSKKEMKETFKYDEINVVEIFKNSKKKLENLDIDAEILYSIEGCDYINDINELEELFNLGLRAILLTWNNPNKYGSGNKSNYGLTKKGKQFIKKAIDLGIGIDLSHANEKTFSDIIEIVKKYPKAICYASHSNIYSLKKNKRNLNDNQLQLLKEINGKLGLVAYSPFIGDGNDKKQIKKDYLNHMAYAVDILGINNVMVASDNMQFAIDTYNDDSASPIYPYSTMKKEMEKDLFKIFNKKQVNKILYDNANALFQQLQKN